MGKKKPCRNRFQTDLRVESSPYMDPLREFPAEDEPMKLKPLDSLLPVGFSWDQPRLVRIDSYRAPPLKLTLETIQEDAPKPGANYLRSKSLPAQRRAAVDSCGPVLQRFPSYRPGQGDYLPGGCRVTMSGPILPSKYDYDSAPKLRRSRLSTRLSRMRDALRRSRIRQALNSVLSKMKPTSKGQQ